MSEAAYWNDIVRPHLSPFGILKRVENAIDVGTPDVSYCLRQSASTRAATGWLELKHIDALPARSATSVRIDHLTLEQVLWGEAWVGAGGRCWMLLRAGGYHMLLKPPVPRYIFSGVLNAAELMRSAEVCAARKFPAGRILKALTE
jgi:hypothetical protein